MSRSHSYINSARDIIGQYKNEMPLHTYLKNYFAKDKKYGSKDRKTIAALCYYYYRLGHGENLLSVEERILLGLYLCESKPNRILEELEPEWNGKVQLPLQEKLFSLESFYSPNIFPWGDELSEGIEAGTFSLSFLLQPKVFLRLRPGKERIVEKKLEVEEVQYEMMNETCIAVENGSKLQDVLEFNKEVVVQDYNSQKVGSLLQLALENVESPTCRVWDCCAASGGKSIMAYDLKPSLDLVVSDVRPSILHNLQQRFNEAGITTYESFLTDLRNYNKVGSEIGDKQYDIIICDAPCSGSGIWGRTPEQLYFFSKEEILRFADLQKTIVGNVIPHLKKGGQLLYITCSVFKKENEDVVNFIQQKFHLELVQQELFKGYSMQADTLFAALFHAK